MKQETITLQGREITLETGEIAKQAGGAVVVKQLDTVVLVTVVAESKPKPDIDFFPLSVDYREKTSAAGRIPSGFIKRENRPQNHEILTSRLIDRSIRPLFPGQFCCETQVMATVLSYDPDADPGPLSIIGASAALMLSDIPWQGPVLGVKLVQRGGEFTLLPSARESKNADLELMLSCSSGGLVMMEGLAREVPDKAIVEAIEFVQQSATPFFELMERWKAKKRECIERVYPQELKDEVALQIKEPLLKIMAEALDKKERKNKFKEVTEAAQTGIEEKYPEQGAMISAIIGETIHHLVREFMLSTQKRIDGRAFDQVRPISGKVGWLPRVHGSALFTRGETQAIVTCTLGTSDDEQIVDSLGGESKERFYLHYNFPPYGVGEVRPIRGPGRREIGHGTLATRALQYTIPAHKKFSYTVRIISDITESNGSSSMASVCGGCLALMDAGVPIKKPVAGVAMGLIKEGENTIILSDILGDEDHLGDMDFKVAGTEAGVTAVQMDNKIGSLSSDIMEKAIEQAFQARLHIMGEMRKILPETRDDLSPCAPRIACLSIRKERIRDLIGPGGKNIQGIQEKYQARVEVNQEGWVRIYSPNKENCRKALNDINYLTKDLEVGKFYRGTVIGVKDFGAFVRIFANSEGLVHISELEKERVDRASDVVREGDEIIVKVLGVERNGKIRLSRKEALDVDKAEIDN